ncbi:MAG: hypothetical protein A2Z99_03200 [Treponema sp. GWB1_62_6]|nr:MAG: hypothetical protein A2001_14060 [Treponema sp. GWC1_61_84]OHE67818.1 MAG: hypothetical protein A2Z99_03200 [Treponema sp. GWB1_62_6]OHE75318.1 MAG: hypothetical protein A2413_08695 [Treponema sp. RIFOXYC1_FULL_61_9]HCM25708.1 hypothetical protein [Treponema sp.]
MIPDSGTLILLADALEVAPDFFFFERVVELSGVNFRRKASHGNKVVESLIERVKDSMDRYLQLETLLGPDSAVPHVVDL